MGNHPIVRRSIFSVTIALTGAFLVVMALGIGDERTLSVAITNASILTASPNPIMVCDGASVGGTTFTWNVAGGTAVELRKDGQTGLLLYQGTGSGSFTASGVPHNTSYHLYSVTTTTSYEWRYVRGRWVRVPVTTTTRSLLDSVTMTHTQDGCGGGGGGAEPLLGAIRWDAWRPDNALYQVAQSVYTDYSYREPFYGWHNVNVPNHQAIIDQEINYAADNGVDYFAYVWYPERPEYQLADLMKPFRDHLSSAVKNRVKFAFVLQTVWLAKGQPEDPSGMENVWRTQTVPELVTLFSDPQYVKVNGNSPVIFWFDSNKLDTQPDGFGTNWVSELQFLKDRIRAAGMGDPVIIDNNMNIAAALKFGFQGITSYGPSGAVPSGTAAKRCWAAQQSKDVANWGPHPGLKTVAGLTPVNDPRPRDYGYWVESPLHSEWFSHVKNSLTWLRQNPASTTNPPLALVYAWNEIDEGGAGIVPTKQEGQRYVEAIKHAKSGFLPAQSINTYNGDHCAIRLTGSGWVDYFPSQGQRDNDEQISTVPGDSMELDMNNASGFDIVGVKGPNRGSMEVLVNGASRGIINLNSANWQTKAILYQERSLPSGSLTLRLRNASTDPNAFQVGIDSISVIAR